MPAKPNEFDEIPSEALKPKQGSRRLDATSVAALRSFTSVVETGGFSAASRQLGMAVSTVSKHVDTLEGRLNTTLLMRTTRRCSLTDSGSRFYESCREALNRIEEAVDQTFNPQEVGGRLRVMTPPSFTSCILSPSLPTFLRQHPGLLVEVVVTTDHRDFLRDQIDVAIRMTEEYSGGVRLERIGKAPSALCASPDYIERFGIPNEPTDLGGHRCLLGMNSPYNDRWRFTVGENAIEIPMKGVFTADTGDVLKDACLQGLGIGGFYLFHAGRDIDAGRLVRVLRDFETDDGVVYAVTPRSKFVPRSTALFIAFVRSLLDDP